MRNPAEKIVKQARPSKTPGTMKGKLAAKKAATAPPKPAPAPAAATPAMQKKNKKKK